MSYILFATYGYEAAKKAAQILTDEGHRVVITSDGIEALEVIAQDKELPSVLFTHLMMPNCDGMELMGTIRCANKFACRNWEKEPLSGYVMVPYSAEQLVLSVEQLLYRDVREHSPAKIVPRNSP